MAIIDAPKTFANLVEDLQKRVRSESGIDASTNIAKRFLNTALRTIHIRNGDALPWSEDEAVLQTRDTYSTGLVTIARGSTALTGVTDSDGVATAWVDTDDFGVANMRAGGKVSIGGSRESYQIASVSFGNQATLSRAFLGTTIDGTTQPDNGGTYQYYEDVYDLDGDFLRPLDHRHFDPDRGIKLYGIREFRRRYGRNSSPGTPVTATILHRNTTSSSELTPTIQFAPPPSTAKGIDYHFVTRKLVLSAGTVNANGSAASNSAGDRIENMVDDDDEPVMPVQYRVIIVLHALATWYRDRKDDARAGSAQAEFDGMLGAMIADNQIGSSRPHIAPAVSHYARRAQQPWSGSGRGRSTVRYDLDDRFDRFED
jgi:hypothetical protein